MEFDFKGRKAKIPRPYQNAALKSLFNYLLADGSGHPLVVAPVASGKSLIIAEFIKEAQDKYPRLKIVLLTHVKELLVQNAEELLSQYPNCDLGFYCAGLGQKKLSSDITFASIQSIHDKGTQFIRSPGLIIVDECHLISPKAATQYRKFIDAVLEINPLCKVIGLTGTPFRTDTGRLDDGENKLFTDIAYEIGMGFMIEEGYWARPVCPKIATVMDVSSVSIRGGDYVVGELQEAVNTTELNDACVKELLKLGEGRQKWLVFTAGVKHAHDVAEEIINAGVSTEVVTGKTPKRERDQIIERFRQGKFRCLVNVAVLTTGFNVPDIDLLCLMRPTRSPVLYIQIIGRGVRPVYADGYDLETREGRLEAIANSHKPDCMVLDFGGVVASLGPIDEVTVKKKYTGEKPPTIPGEAIMKICPQCATECPAGQRYCYACSYCFIELDDHASEHAIVSSDQEPEWKDVIAMHKWLHLKEGGVPSMEVVYATMGKNYKEWVCFEHHEFEPGDKRRWAWNKAVEWHNARLPGQRVPNSVEQALDINYPTPSKVLVKKEGKWWRILDYDWTPSTDQENEERLNQFLEDETL